MKKDKNFVYINYIDKDIYIKLKIKGILIFWQKDSIKNLCSLIVKLNKKNIIIYSNNVTLLFLSLIREFPNLKEKFNVDSFLEKDLVYFFSLEEVNTKNRCIFKCFTKFIINVEENLDLNDKNIEIISGDFIKTMEKEIGYLSENIVQMYRNWEKFSYSISSISINIFKFNFNKKFIEIRTSIEEDLIFRKAYFGGRCEVFGNVEGFNEKIFHFDFNSMYGQIMMQKFPLKEYIYKEANLNINRPGFYYIKIKSLNLNIPVLPHRSEEEADGQDMGIMFTNGEFEGLYWYEEILLFKEEGGLIEEIVYGYEFTKKEDYVFKSFAEYCILKKKNGNASERKIWKSILVSFYGRLGMGKRTSKTILMFEKDYLENKKKYEIIREVWFRGNECGVVEIKNIEVRKELPSSVMYAAIITSKARVKLYRAFKEVEKNGGRVLYCDTDSIFAAYKRDVGNEKHGDIFWDSKKKNTRIDEAVFAAVRTYSIRNKGEWETKISGTPRNHVSFDNFYKSFHNMRSGGYFARINKKSIFNFNEWNEEKVIWMDCYKKRQFYNNKLNSKPLFKKGGTYINEPLF